MLSTLRGIRCLTSVGFERWTERCSVEMEEQRFIEAECFGNSE